MSGTSIERLLDKIESDIPNFLIFVGVLDNNAKLVSFRRGKASFSLPIERHDTLDVQLSLMFSLIRQLEDISGSHKFTVSRFAKQDVFLFGTGGLHIFVITSPTSEGQVAKKLAELVATINEAEPSMAPSAPSAPSLGSRTNEQAMRPIMSSMYDQPSIEIQKFPTRPQQETIVMLRGYLMALEVDCTIQEEGGSSYKIKANKKDSRLPWKMLEKMNSAFKEKVNLEDIGVDADAKVFFTISLM
jgi:hypothetical protein